MSHALKQVFNKDKTFRPKRKFEPGTQRFELHKKAQASLNAGLDLKVAVQLPPGEEQNDWVAVHVVDFFNRINLIYGTISDYCTEQSCPVMSGGPKYEYRWQDEHKYRKPTALSAPQYMNLLMDWIEVQINNEDIFPTNVAPIVWKAKDKMQQRCAKWQKGRPCLETSPGWRVTSFSPAWQPPHFHTKKWLDLLLWQAQLLALPKQPEAVGRAPWFGTWIVGATLESRSELPTAAHEACAFLAC
uniref:MOB kinase activator 3A n=1 Tax=Apteryx owenii TaxID=8824 RepID=A0A8B9Q6E2_APTOW